MEVARGGLLSVRSVRPAPLDARLSGAGVDHPSEGDVEDTYALRVSGWAVGRSSPVVRLEVLSRGRLLHAQRPNRPRRDLLEAHETPPGQERAGFELLVGLIGLPTEFHLMLRALLEDGTHAPIATVTGERVLLRSAVSPRLSPLMVTSLGRTGTTWLMEMLAEHPEVVTFRRHPYEVRAAQHWAGALQVLSAPADHELSSGPDPEQPLHWVGRNPYYTTAMVRRPELRAWLGRDQPEAQADFLKRTVDGWYAAVAAGQGDEAAAYFAEKCSPTHVPSVLWEVYPEAREVVLVRDFRDMVSSILAFDRRRGYPGFGRGEEEPDESYARRLGTHARSLLAAWHERRARAHLVRYEDLVAAPEATLLRLLDYVGVDRSAAVVEAMVATGGRGRGRRADHTTTPDLGASVGRWRRENPTLRSVLEETFAETLAAFGYEDGDSVRRTGTHPSSGRSAEEAS